jgi:hypothetical protein
VGERVLINRAITVPIYAEPHCAVNLNKINNMDSYESVKEKPIDTKNGIHFRHIPISGEIAVKSMP